MNRLTIQISDCCPTMRTGTNLAVKRSLAHKCRFPVKPHAHAHATDNKKLLARRLRTQLFAQLDELEQGIGAIEHPNLRSEEHTSELQSLMRISYAVFCLNNKR